MPKVVGLTGSIATGKSSTSAIFRSNGIPIVDADEIARQVVRKGSLGLFLIRLSFGKEMLREDGSLDREKLGSAVFRDKKKRQRLNRCTHPLIILEMARQLLVHLLFRFQPIVVLDTPLLFETKVLLSVCTHTVVVACSEENQLSRLISRNELSLEEAQNRISSQMPLALKKERATYVVDNDGTLDQLESNVGTVLQCLKPSVAVETVFRVGTCALYAASCFFLGRRLFLFRKNT